MKTIPFVNEGLGNSSYVVDLGAGKAVLVDPDRSVDRYMDVLRRDDLQAIGVFETHLHADFVSGARELGHQMEAPVFVPAGGQVAFPHTGVLHDQMVHLNGSDVSVIASPGHTPEHVSYLVQAVGSPPLLFSGGSLIVGGAARTDLISPAMTEPLTRAQFRTLRQAFTELPDETLLYPTHGGGSFCSTGAGGERSSTLGRERRENPLLSLTDEEEFVSWFPSTFPSVPEYFFRMRALNQAGPRLRHLIPDPRALDAAEFAELRSSSIIVDARGKEDYAAGHIPGSFNNTLRDAYAVWLGWLVPENARLLFVTDDHTPIEEIVTESLLVGYESFGGWLKGGAEAWSESGRALETTELVDAREARRYLLEGAASVDIREPSEYQEGHIEGSLHVPLGKLMEAMHLVPKDRPLVVYCGHGERASTAISVLEGAGWRNLVNLDGGIGAWSSAGYKVQQGA